MGEKGLGMADPVTDLVGIGKVSSSWLREVGIHTRGDLHRQGVVRVYQKVKHHRGERVSLNLLWALHGGLNDMHWTLIPPRERDRLKEALALAEKTAD